MKNDVTPNSLRFCLRKIWILPLLMCLSATASAAINSFERAVTFPEKAKVLRFLKADFYT